jgi:hypothetical protein
VAITFQIAPVIAPGDAPTSTAHNKLAEAFNSRIRSGVGDSAWRIAWYLHSATKQVTYSPDAATDEFTKIYGLYDQANAPDWPDADVGANTNSSPLMKFAFGDPSLGPEDQRLDLTLPDSSNPEAIWQTAKLQRGFIELPSGVQEAPAKTAAQEHFKITPNPVGKFLVSYGGWLPSPLPVSGFPLCGDGIDGVRPDTDNLDIFFTPLEGNDEEVRHYSGFCPGDSPGAEQAQAIKGIYFGPLSYHVYLWDGTVDVLRVDEWTIGPFTGPGRLNHGGSAFIDQSLNRYLSTFRGSTEERALANFNAANFGFDFEEFLSSQYLLAPSKGVAVGDLITESTTNHTEPGPTIAMGELFSGGTSDGFVFGGIFAKGTGLTSPTSITITLGDQRYSVQITPESPTAYVYSRAGISGAYAVSNDSEATTEASGSIYIEILELEEYTPGIHDAYLVARLGSAPSALPENGQTDGDAFGSPKSISEAYFSHGLIHNLDSGGLAPIAENRAADNAIIESARRVAMDNMRLASGVEDANQVVKYAVIDGKSVVWFKRSVFGQDEADLFRGLGPMLVESGSIQDGVTYIATSDSLTYNGVLIQKDAEFVGVFGVSDYTGDGYAKEKDGIKADAPKRGWSNEWVMVPTWIHGARSQAEESIWKESAFAGPYVAFNNPCHVFSESIRRNPMLNTQFNYGEKFSIYKSEAPSGMNFAAGMGVNDELTRFIPEDEVSSVMSAHFTSCQIYQKPYEVESAVMDGALVKVTFTTRFRHHSTAPDSIPDSAELWNRQLLGEENYQTDEGRLMKYLLMRLPGGPIPLTTYGDAALDGISDLQILTDDPHAAVIPKFYFVRLIPKAYEDCNDDVSDEDSIMTVESMLQMELYARPMCEGFIDGEATTRQNDCELSAIEEAKLYDFTFENAMLQATDGATIWMQTLPSSVVGNKKGYGPLPRTALYADQFNQLSNFVNLLTRARIDLPLVLEARSTARTGYAVASPYDESGGLPSVSGGPTLTTLTGFTGWALWEGQAPTSGFNEVVGEWQTVTANEFGQIAFQANKSNQLSSSFLIANGADYAWAQEGTETEIEWRIKPDSEAWDALSDDLRSLVTENAGLLMQQVDVTAYGEQWNTSSGDAVQDCDGTAFPRASTFTTPGISTASEASCYITSGGTITASTPPEARSIVHLPPSGFPCVYGGSSTTRTLTVASGSNIGQGNVFVDVPVVDIDPCDDET